MTDTEPTSNNTANPPTLDTAPGNAGFILTLLAASIVILNGALSFFLAVATDPGRDVSHLIGYISGRVLIAPLIVVALFQIGKRYRNPRSQIKVLFWASLVVLVSLLGSFASLASQR